MFSTSKVKGCSFACGFVDCYDGSGHTIISIASTVTTVLNKEQLIDRHRRSRTIMSQARRIQVGAFFGPKKKQNKKRV
jgi:hypothetical protein